MPREKTVVAEAQPCLRYPACKNRARIRGLCGSDYNAYRNARRAGISEEELVRAGKILPAYGGKTAKSWFSEVVNRG